MTKEIHFSEQSWSHEEREVRPRDLAQGTRLNCPECGALLWHYPDGRETCSRCEYEEGSAAQSPAGKERPAANDLVERLRNPMWAHGNIPFESPQLEQEENLAAMAEAAAEIERLVGLFEGVRAQAIEECAMVASCYSPSPWDVERMRAGIIEAIRALSLTSTVREAK
jgi:uncharacterized Zn finger protein (UPF0148 family)